MLPPIRGQYQPLEKLGSGGMGDVYQARDQRLNRMVALKVLRPDDRNDAERRRRFLQEAQAASALNHPNIITIHDIIAEPDADVMVMEYVEGQTIDQLMPASGFRVGQVLRYGEQIADALATAHHAGIVHRDLKPSNIMVTNRDLVKLLDFGLAKWDSNALHQNDPDVTRSAPLTMQGSIVGTFCYMSPEQAQGLRADARSDIFSFGAVLYEMATGRRAFTGDNGISMLSSVLKDSPERVLSISPDLPPILDQLIHRCLEKDPNARYQSMSEVHGYLSILRQQLDSGVLATASIPVPQPPPASKKWMIWTAGGLACGFLAMFLGLQYAKQRTEAEPPPQSQSAAAPAPQPPPPPPRPSPSAPLEPKKSEPVASQPATPPAQAPAVKPVTLRDGTPIGLTLAADVAEDSAAGAKVPFSVTSDVKVDGVVLIAQGTPVTAEIVASEKRRRFIVGGGRRVVVKMAPLPLASGGRLKLRAAPAAGGEDEGARELKTPTAKKKIVAEKGAPWMAYVDGEQVVKITP